MAKNANTLSQRPAIAIPDVRYAIAIRIAVWKSCARTIHICRARKSFSDAESHKSCHLSRFTRRSLPDSAAYTPPTISVICIIWARIASKYWQSNHSCWNARAVSAHRRAAEKVRSLSCFSLYIHAVAKQTSVPSNSHPYRFRGKVKNKLAKNRSDSGGTLHSKTIFRGKPIAA